MDKKRYNGMRTAALLLAFTISTTLFSGFSANDDRHFSIAKNLDIFNSLYKELDMFYVDSVDAEKAITDAIYAMLAGLDPYTNYIPESDKEEISIITSGEYGGIGAMIMGRDEYVTITEPYEGMPAQKAGLRAGDRLLRLDNTDLKGKSSDTVSSMLKGPANTKFKLTIERPGEPQPIVKEITRKKIVVNTVPYYGVVGDSIGYIYLSNFTDKSAKEVKSALLDLKENKHIKSLILDIRNNPGGVMEDAIQIVNLFVPKGKEVLSTRGKVKQWDRTYKTTQEPVDAEIPLALLVDRGSASSSEIVAGALQDMDRAVIIGTQTFGKGLVQSIRPLPYGGTMKVTIAKYYIPSGRLIQAINYAKRNADGSVARIPDSLTTVFKTANGRSVRDGGGIKPDVEIKRERNGNIGFYLLNDFIIFDYATQYAQKHPSIAPIEQFTLSDEDYADFKKFVHSKDFKYDRQSDKVLKELREIAKFEGYLEGATAEFDSLEARLNHNLDFDLDKFRPDIEEIIRIELAKRYYYQKGEIIESLKNDDELEEAKKILSSPEKYRKLLSAEPKEPESVKPEKPTINKK